MQNVTGVNEIVTIILYVKIANVGLGESHFSATISCHYFMIVNINGLYFKI